MKTMVRALLVAVVMTVTGVTGSGAQTTAETDAALDSLFGNHAPYRDFFGKLQKAVGDNDKKAVATLVDYPFQARIGGKAVKLRDAAHFVAEYDKIVTAKVKHAVSGQTYQTLFANWQGVMIGDGEMWFSAVGDGGSIKIIAIND